MSYSQEVSSQGDQKRFKGVRRRKWGKWVSEIRVPGTRERLWLGSYSNPEAAAIAYDTATFCLRGPSSVTHLNFPMYLPNSLQTDMSPRSIQTAATNAAMAIDFELARRAPEAVDDTVQEGAILQVPSSVTHLNFLETDMSPRSIQTTATNATRAIDFELARRAPGGAHNTIQEGAMQVLESRIFEEMDHNPGMYEGGHLREGEALNISVDDFEIYQG
ncbi:hypothetical protein NE237_017193 [Protea cynaroides]|uniref:AP2/ERF domain-containing protein n=1 Tax=Protea cynaroides TaxID=273540 RepID=A0A9Q0K7K3_9MAGN|nr:hypothetical protein NE237_017193 [Protea cynaroides]